MNKIRSLALLVFFFLSIWARCFASAQVGTGLILPAQVALYNPGSGSVTAYVEVHTNTGLLLPLQDTTGTYWPNTTITIASHTAVGLGWAITQTKPDATHYLKAIPTNQYYLQIYITSGTLTESTVGTVDSSAGSGNGIATGLPAPNATSPTVLNCLITYFISSGGVVSSPSGITSINGSVTFSPYADISNVGTITAADTGSTATTQANGQVAYTGTPTAGSVIALGSISGQPTSIFQITGSGWTGTWQIEKSYDGGTTWFVSGGKVNGAAYDVSTGTSNQTLIGSAAGTTNLRIRATSTVSGTISGLVKASYASAYNYTSTNMASWAGGPAPALVANSIQTNTATTLNTFSSGGEASNSVTTSAATLTASGGGDPTNSLYVVVTNTGGFDAWVSPVSGGHTWLCPAGTTTYIPASSTTLYSLAVASSTTLYCIKAAH